MIRVPSKFLRTHKRAQVVERLKAGPVWQNSGLVFAREDGRPLPPDWVYKRFVGLVLAAGVPVIPFHGLRHTHGTAGLEAGVDLKVMSVRLGHSSVRITADTYQHVERAMDQDAAARAAALDSASLQSVSEGDDVVVQLGDKRLRLAAGMLESLAWAKDVAVGLSADGQAVLLVFLTDEPTAEEIGSGGVERVAKIGVQLTRENFLKFADYVQANAKKL